MRIWERRLIGVLALGGRFLAAAWVHVCHLPIRVDSGSHGGKPDRRFAVERRPDPVIQPAG